MSPLEMGPALNGLMAVLVGVGFMCLLLGSWHAVHAVWDGLAADRKEKVSSVVSFLFGPETDPADTLALVALANVLGASGLWVAGLAPASILLVLILGTAVPVFLYYRGAGQRARELELALPLALQQVANEMAAGATLETALKKVADSAPPPADVEISRLQRRVEVMGIEDAFIEMAKRLDSRSFALTASVVRVGTSSGGRLIEALKSLSRTLIEIERLNKKIRTASENGRRNLYLISFIGPVVAIGSGLVVDHETSLLEDGLGQVLIGLAIIMFFAAHVIGFQLTKVKV
ncbi:MAG: type II secretion system F family protein [Pseudomonadota bacterium]